MSFPIIEKPRRKSEFEFQAELYFRLKTLGYDVRGEVPAKTNGRKSCFDLVIFNHAGAALIIEVKNTPHEAVINGKKTRQTEKYKEYGIPLLFFTSIIPVDDILKRVNEIMEN